MLSITDDGILSCPVCGHDFTHVDDVYVDGCARENDGGAAVHVDRRGEVDTPDPMPRGFVGPRRHAITVVGSCEGCRHLFAIKFAQNKGQTEVTVLRNDWRPHSTNPIPLAQS